eukprot:CAMPEP_0177657922 /NCGR_PEP_ID=MMETSP0447-20121125/16502_1 /TAXON_ID=0 /ORGANISM="Stygamoeba regulata, Strain BSH-02190019" /LENGTH=118 /DNA_ID=CAMNT_0019162427 /DNA_START=247 /DNA_END=603 /DNA_ORIENTATION=-
MDDKAFRPSMDVHRDEKAITITADLPGIKEDDIKIVVKDGQLKISGKREEHTEKKNEDGSSFYTERRFGSFQRSFQLPEGTTTDGINAALKDGVLQVSIPVPASTEVVNEHQIPVSKL